MFGIFFLLLTLIIQSCILSFELSGIYLYTFGQPRVWDYATAQVFNDWVPHAWRVVHYSDPIPHGPSLNGKEQGKPYHHAQEIWYNDNFTTYSQCSKDDGEDLNCSDKLNNFKFVTDVVNKDHLHYFGVQVIDYGAAGCTTNIVHAYKLFSSLTFVLLQLFVFA
ncbi:unnamed protein product, partial [Mesorhabditis belari]|uniref:Fungal lipase-type domain-containing protein n=1 Tax=Mesorhabditis belari TaxID=2138241 RepID=A0AAF3EGW4_9BILA